MKKTLITLFALITVTFSISLSAGEPGENIFTHTPADDGIYIGYGPVWGTSFAAWNQARLQAYNACVGDGNVGCHLSVAAWDHCNFWGDGATGNWVSSPPRYKCVSHPPLVTDSDGDGVNDDADQCQNTNLEGSVAVGGIETLVTNTFFEATGCAISDIVGNVESDCSVGARNHGQFVSCFARGVNDLKSTGVLTGKEKGELQSAAAQSNLP